jgi:hypothetical protein
LLVSPSPDDADKGMGSLAYAPAYSRFEIFPATEESYGITLHVTEEEFASVRSLFSIGKCPRKVSIASPDLEYDGSAHDVIKWDVVERSFAKITGYELEISVDDPRVMVGPKRDPDEAADAEREAEQREQEVRGAIKSVAGMAAMIDRLRVQLSVLILLAGGSLAFLALLYFQK